MNGAQRRRLAVTLVAAIGVVAPSLARGLSVADVLARVDSSYEVRIARSAVDAAATTLASLAYPGSVAVSVDPGVRATTPLGGSFAQQIDLTGAVSLRVPLGLTEAAKDKVDAARLTLAVAEADLHAARSSVYSGLYSLYQEAWLARAELDVLDLEVQSAKLGAESAEGRYEAGEISLAELKRAEDDLWKAQDALLTGGLEQRLSWLSLLYASGQEKQPADALDPAIPEATSLPDVTELVDWSQRRLASVIEQRARVEAAARSLRELRTLPFDLDARITGSFQSHTAAVSYATDTPQITATYSFPIYTLGSTGGASPSTLTWSLGLTAGVSFDVGRADRLAADALGAGLRRETQRLDSLLRTTELGIRSRYQQWIKAKEGVQQAQRTLDRAREAQRIVDTKIEMGQASPSDQLLAQAAVGRAQWTVSRARVSAEEARLAAAQAAGYLDEMVGLER